MDDKLFIMIYPKIMEYCIDVNKLEDGDGDEMFNTNQHPLSFNQKLIMFCHVMSSV